MCQAAMLSRCTRVCSSQELAPITTSITVLVKYTLSVSDT
jgi:hypothetical protein